MPEGVLRQRESKSEFIILIYNSAYACQSKLKE